MYEFVDRPVTSRDHGDRFLVWSMRARVKSTHDSRCPCTAKGDEISLNGFGKFKVKASPAREGRNPSTGETIKIKASKKLTFAAAKAVKDRLNG